LKNLDSVSGSEVHPQTLYAETKHLVFVILHGLPNLSGKASQDLKATLLEASKYAQAHKDLILDEQIKKTIDNLNKLREAKIVTEADNYSKLRRDVAEELVNIEKLNDKIRTETETLGTVLNNIRDHNKFLLCQLDVYKEYLQNVREKAYGPKVTKKPLSKTKTAKPRATGPFKYTYQQLEKDGVIMSSEVPEERRTGVCFSFESTLPGVFDISLSYKGRTKPICELELDDLLERQHNNDLELDLDYMKLNVNMVIHLLSKAFMK